MAITAKKPSEIVIRGKATAIALCVLGMLLGALAAAPSPKRARPPKFDKATSDAFLPDAREKLVGPRPQKAAGDADRAAPEGTAAENSARPASGSLWSRLISSETLEDEIKAQVLKLDETVQNSAKFKGGDYQRARLHFSVLAVLFAVDAEYDQPARWQKQAAAMRDLLGKAAAGCRVASDNSFRESKQRAEDLRSLMSGNWHPGQDKDPSPSAWGAVADRDQLMKRLEEAQQKNIAPATAGENQFNRNADRLAHESELVAVLADVITRDGYEFAEDDEYREYAQAMRAQALALRDSVRHKSYVQARQAAGELAKACSKCHEGYRN